MQLLKRDLEWENASKASISNAQQLGSVLTVLADSMTCEPFEGGCFQISCSQVANPLQVGALEKYIHTFPHSRLGLKLPILLVMGKMNGLAWARVFSFVLIQFSTVIHHFSDWPLSPPGRWSLTTSGRFTSAKFHYPLLALEAQTNLSCPGSMK